MTTFITVPYALGAIVGTQERCHFAPRVNAVVYSHFLQFQKQSKHSVEASAKFQVGKSEPYHL